MATIGVHPSADGATSYSVNGQQMVTERQAVERERAAYVRGAQDRQRMDRPRADVDPTVSPNGQDMRLASSYAAERWPLPKVTRPRVVPDPHTPTTLRWMATETGGIFGATPGEEGWGCWRDIASMPTPDRVALWSDLLAQPTEEVTP